MQESTNKKAQRHFFPSSAFTSAGGVIGVHGHCDRPQPRWMSSRVPIAISSHRRVQRLALLGWHAASSHLLPDVRQLIPPPTTKITSCGIDSHPCQHRHLLVERFSRSPHSPHGAPSIWISLCVAHVLRESDAASPGRGDQTWAFYM